ncbi:MAG: T9SS type A sorting domain-containing protein [Bacteroidia bacterium]
MFTTLSKAEFILLLRLSTIAFSQIQTQKRMKKIIIILVGILSIKSIAQQVSFCPPGAEWHYSFTEFYPSNGYINETIKHTSNLIQGTDTLKLLTHTKFFTRLNSPPTFTTLIKQKGDTIYMKNVKTNDQWQILYNFAAQVNQSWTNTFYVGTSTTITYTTLVTAIGTKQIGSKTVKELTVNYTNSYGSNYSHSGLITEFYGSNRFLFNYIARHISDGDYFAGFLCYTDSVIGTTQFTDKPCDYSNITDLEHTDIFDALVSVFPNPTKDKVNLKFNSSLNSYDISIHNLVGENIYFTNYISDHHEIDFNFLQKGVYFLNLREGNKQKTIKIVKE